MKKLKITAIVIIIILISLSAFSCSQRHSFIKSISIKPNSFKTVYDIDEKLNYDNIFILITYNNGNNEYFQCDHSIIYGFDTSTSGEKQLYVEYGKVKSEVHDYEVIYSIDNSKKIITTARLENQTTVKNEILSYKINYYSGDLINVGAILFSIIGKESLNINSDHSNISFELPNGWHYYIENISEKAIRILFYNKDNAEGLNANSAFLINVNKGNIESGISLKDIEISTSGNNASKYYLPDYRR